MGIIENKNWRMLFFFVYFAAIFCGLIHMHYATDTYGNIYNSNVDWQLAVGRYSIYILASIFNVLNISLVEYQQLFMISTLLILIISAEILFLCFQDKLVQNWHIVLVLLICLSFGNVFSTELYLFPEYTIYNALGIFFAVFAVYALNNHGKLACFYACLALILSLGFYQANIGYFFITALTVVLLKKNISRKIWFHQILRIFLVAGSASVFNILMKKVLVFLNFTHTISRDAELSLHTIIDNLQIVIGEQYRILILGDELLPKYTLVFFIVCPVIICIYNLIKKGKSIISIIITLLLILVEYFCVYAPHLIAGGVWLSPRTITPLFVFISCIMILAMDSLNEESAKNRNTITLGVCLLLVINFWSVQGIITNHIATNKVDQEFAYCIYSEIEKYEELSGNTVTNIATVNDEIPMWKNRSINYYSYNINERAYINEWSDVTLVNFVSKKHFQKTEMDSTIYNEHFKGKDWDYYCPEEQLYFEKDTLYWCKY